MQIGGGEVYAFEVIPEIYQLALKNINLNPDLMDKIQLYNKGLACQKGKMKFYWKSIKDSAGASSFSKEGKSIEVDTLTINDIINDYNIKPDILKMDCEGCEYSIIQKTDLSIFNEIFLEYHQKITGKPYTILIDKLEEEGFKTEHKSILGLDISDIGIIHAYK